MHAATSTLMSSGSGAALHRFSAAGLAQVSAADALSLDSHELLRGQKTVEIKHNGSVYRLQTTKLGKLILTK
jgi:hemin uptake protein HemP